jgi:hypothetical protein
MYENINIPITIGFALEFLCEHKITSTFEGKFTIFQKKTIFKILIIELEKGNMNKLCHIIEIIFTI